MLFAYSTPGVRTAKVQVQMPEIGTGGVVTYEIGVSKWKSLLYRMTYSLSRKAGILSKLGALLFLRLGAQSIFQAQRMIVYRAKSYLPSQFEVKVQIL